MDEETAGKVLYSLLLGINYMQNKKICHRDIKPENIMIDKRNWVLKLADFGAACHYEVGEDMVERFGTPYYIAPEILENKYNHKCDNWSIGVILYVLLTGKPPFYGRNPN